jgi:hypothetical protein
MNAADQPCRFVGVTGFAFYRSHLVRMRIILDGGVAIPALQAAVDAGMKLCGVNGNAMSRGVLYARVRVAGKAIRLRLNSAGRREKQERRCGQG